jgi:hypothetical protein
MPSREDTLSVSFLPTTIRIKYSGIFAMTVTSASATEFFKSDLEWAKKDSSEQYEYSVGLRQREFFPQLAAAVFSGIFSAINVRYDDLISEALTDEGMRALNLRGDVRALAFKDDRNQDILLAWEAPGQTKEHRTIKVFSCKPRLPDDLQQEIEGLLSSSNYSLESLDRACQLASDFSTAHHSEDLDPTDIDHLVARIANDGLHRVGTDSDVAGSYYEFPNGRGFKFKGHGGWRSNISLLMGLVDTFGMAETNDFDFDEFKTPAILKEGRALELQASIAALQLETIWAKHQETIKEIVGASVLLDLSQSAILDYGSRSCYVHRSEGRDVYVHENPSRNEQNTFLLVLTGPRYSYERLDILISRPWHADLENYGIDTTKTTLRTFAEYASYKGVNGGTPTEMAALENALKGERPGLVASYDFRTREFKPGPFFEKTSFFDYLPHMLELDHKALTDIENGDLVQFGSSTIAKRPTMSTDVESIEHIDIKDWLEGLGRTANAFNI